MAKNSIATAYVQIIPTTDGIKDDLNKQLGGAGDEAGKNSGNRFGSMFKKAIAAAGVGAAFKAALEAGGDLQQSFGGLETIYGDAAEAAKKYAAEAAAAGISANDYAEQAVSFGASLKQAFEGDTAKAVEAANTAIMDMTDNAAKMGTPLENIQNAYQGFAKQNYTMLDNLKLGYGGTKTEMERLLADAQKLTGVKYDIGNLGDVYDAIHVIQEDLGLTGVAAEEATETFTGSLGAMKAAAQNVLGNLALGKDIMPSLEVLGDTVMTFLGKNLIPMAENVISALPGALSKVITKLAPKLIPAGIDLLTNLISGIAKSTPELITTIVKLVPLMTKQLIQGLPQIKQVGVDLVKGLWRGISDTFSWLVEQIRGFAKNVLGKLKNFFGIHSPSTETAWFGEMLNAGLAKGVNDNLGIVENAMGNLRDTALGELNPTVRGEYNVSSTAAENDADVIRLLRTYLPKLVEIAERDTTFSVNNREFARAVKAVG